MATTKADYIVALMREIERLRPIPSWSRYRHAITYDGGALVLLVCVGDALWLYKINSADLSDDPVDTAARLVEQFKDKIVNDSDPAHYW